METEIWEFEAGDKSVSKPLLPESTYQHGIALFSVDFEFCKRWVLIKLNECSLRIVFIATVGQDRKKNKLWVCIKSRKFGGNLILALEIIVISNSDGSKIFIWNQSVCGKPTFLLLISLF